MGARPIALLNSLRFGSLDGAGARAASARRRRRGHRRLRQQHRHSDRRRRDRLRATSYAGNPLVNVFCLGIAEADATSSKASPPAPAIAVYYVGAKTGRDGIHGATMASAEFDEKSAEKRPAVQVGDPFMEKLLLEACLEVMKTDALDRHSGHGRRRADLLDDRDGIARRRGRRDRRRARAAARDRHDAVRDHALRIAGADAARRQAAGAKPKSSAIFDKWDLHAVAHRRGHRPTACCA